METLPPEPALPPVLLGTQTSAPLGATLGTVCGPQTIALAAPAPVRAMIPATGIAAMAAIALSIVVDALAL
jgi:hypothetical protein